MRIMNDTGGRRQMIQRGGVEQEKHLFFFFGKFLQYLFNEHFCAVVLKKMQFYLLGFDTISK